MSKTDLRIRPVLYRLRNRIEAHVCISFTGYAIYKELERLLKQAKSTLSIKRSVELAHNMYQITYMLPQSKHTKSNLLKIDVKQDELYNIIKFFIECPIAENRKTCCCVKQLVFGYSQLHITHLQLNSANYQLCNAFFKLSWHNINLLVCIYKQYKISLKLIYT